MTLRRACLIHSVSISGQTPGGNVEAAGQSGGSSNHSSGDVSIAWGRWRIGGKYEGQQSPARATQSPWGKVDCTVHFLTFLQLFHYFHTTVPVPCVLCNITLIDTVRETGFIVYYLHVIISGQLKDSTGGCCRTERLKLKHWFSTGVFFVSVLFRVSCKLGVVKEMTWHFDSEGLLQRSIN